VSSQRTEKIVGGRKIILEKPEVLAQGTGIFISSDGLVAAPDLFVADSAQKILLFAGNRQIEAKLVKRDEKNGLVLLKAEENDLPVLPFFEGELKLGERMFLIDAKSGNASVNMGFVDSFEPNPSIFFQTSKTTGGPIFNSKGELIGLGLLQAPDGHMAVVAAKIIRELIK
jgi:serine protease Do